MKKIIPIITIALVFIMSGCAIMKKQNSVNDQLENLVLDVSAKRAFAAALKYSGAEPTGKYQASTNWVMHEKVFGSSKRYQEKDRYLIKVTPQGKTKSLLRIQRQHTSNFVGGEWQDKPYLSRDTAYEHNLIKSKFPAIANEIERKAMIASKK